MKIVNHIKKALLQKKIEAYQELGWIQVPSEGWIKCIRTLLGMSQSQLAKRMGVSPPAISHFEESEQEETITLSTLKKTAEALNCRVVHVFIPNKPVDEIIYAQAYKKASEMMEPVSHSMKLEDQGLSDSENVEYIKQVALELIRSKSKKIWEP